MLFKSFLFQGKGEGKVIYNKDLSCFPRHNVHTALVTFAICGPMYKGIQDSLAFWIPRTGFQSLSLERGFWIPIVSGIQVNSLSCIPNSTKAQDSGFSEKQNFPGFRIPQFHVLLKCPVSNSRYFTHYR